MSNTTNNNKRSEIIIPIALFLFMFGGVISFVSGYLFARREKPQTISAEEETATASTSEYSSNEASSTDDTPIESIHIEAGMNESVSLDWSKELPKEYVITFEVNECDDKCTIILSAHEACDFSYSYHCHSDGFGTLFSHDIENIPDTITGFKASDVNFDGFTDLLFTGTIDSKEMSWLIIGDSITSDPFDDPEGTYFMTYPPITDATQYLNKSFSVDDVSDYYSKGQINGEFNSYKEGYKAIIDFYETLSAGTNRYDLININNDDIPELLMDTGEGGNNFSVCTFKNGYVHQFINWHHLKNDYEYVPSKNIILSKIGTESYVYSMKDCKLNSGFIEDLSDYKSNPFREITSFSGKETADDFIRKQLD